VISVDAKCQKLHNYATFILKANILNYRALH